MAFSRMTMLVATVCVVAGCSTSLLENAGNADMSGPDESSTFSNSPGSNGTSDASMDPRDMGSTSPSDDMMPPSDTNAADLGVDMAVDMPPDMAEPMRVPACAVQCQIPADCTGTLMGGLFDEENYACEMGACRWLGCISDAECDGINPGTECKLSAFGFMSCLSPCTAPTDCAVAGMGPYDADNYLCVQGSCEYQGCLNDAECQTLGANYRCAITTLAYPTCVLGCQTPNDCATTGAGGAYDADNYACTLGACEYLGCMSDAECQQTSPTYVCR